MSTDSPTRRRGLSPRRRAVCYGVLAAFVLLAALTVRYVMMPRTDEPRRADAIFMLGGPGDRRGKAYELARSGIAPVLVIATPGSSVCPAAAEVRADVRIICFRPDPSTTQGEAREAARLAGLYQWNSMVFVTDRSQVSRARLRIERCYGGEVLMTATETPLRQWPYLFAYQTAATGKALVLQREC